MHVCPPPPPPPENSVSGNRTQIRLIFDGNANANSVADEQNHDCIDTLHTWLCVMTKKHIKHVYISEIVEFDVWWKHFETVTINFQEASWWKLCVFGWRWGWGYFLPYLWGKLPLWWYPIQTRIVPNCLHPQQLELAYAFHWQGTIMA